MLTLPPLSLYIHIPWCIKKCPYCDFNSHEKNQKNHFNEAAYIKALQNDLTQEYQWLKNNNDFRKLHSIFFGGGTPSLFSAKGIEKILTIAEKIMGFQEDIEITLEANPSTFEQEKFSGFFIAGVNRLSIGIQSFNSSHLQQLGRIHNSDEATQAVHIAQRAGFDNINIDIMHGLPQQTTDEAISDLQTAIAFSPQHISWYQLTIEPNTAFYHRPPSLPNDEALDDIYNAGFHLLSTSGFEQYEVSAFSSTHQQSKHNMNYWQFGDYIGIGAGAHGKLTNIQQSSIIRRHKTRLPEHYLASSDAPKFKEAIVDPVDLPLEFMMNVLRLNKGVATDSFSHRTGLPLNTMQPLIHDLQQKKLLEEDTGRIMTTALGGRFLNSVLEKCSHFFSQKSNIIHSE